MGDIADALLEGTLCESCGEWMGNAGFGFPRRCGPCLDLGKPPIPTGLPGRTARIRKVKPLRAKQKKTNPHPGPCVICRFNWKAHQPGDKRYHMSQSKKKGFNKHEWQGADPLEWDFFTLPKEKLNAQED